MNKPTLLTTSQEDAQADAEFASALLTDELGPEKGVRDEEDSDNEPDTSEGSRAKPGPIDEATRAEALTIKQEYEERMMALACEKCVSPHSLFRAVGDDITKH